MIAKLNKYMLLTALVFAAGIVLMRSLPDKPNPVPTPPPPIPTVMCGVASPVDSMFMH